MGDAELGPLEQGSLAVQVMPSARALKAFLKLPDDEFARLVEAIREPEQFTPAVVRRFADAGSIDLEDLGWALNFGLGAAVTDDPTTGERAMAGAVDDYVSDGKLAAADAERLKVRLRTIAAELGPAYGRQRSVHKALSNTFPVLSHVHTAVSTVTVKSSSFEPDKVSVADYVPEVGEMLPVVVVQIDVDAYGDERQFAFALTAKQLAKLSARLEAAAKELALAREGSRGTPQGTVEHAKKA